MRELLNNERFHNVLHVFDASGKREIAYEKPLNIFFLLFFCINIGVLTFYVLQKKRNEMLWKDIRSEKRGDFVKLGTLKSFVGWN
jgi:hypothetical protein